jgi:hypothetical protein
MQITHLTDQRQVVIPKTSLAKTKLADVAGCLAYRENAKTIEQINEAIQEGVITLWGLNDSR